MRNETGSISQLAADMVLSVREYLDAPSMGQDSSQTAATVKSRVLELAEAFYATEEVYAMEVCFTPRREVPARSGHRPCASQWRERKIYHRIAKFMASLAQLPMGEAKGDHGVSAMALVLDRPYQNLCSALGGAGYLKA